MFYIFEMANNHNGSVKHAKKIIDEFAALANSFDIKAGIKLQLRQLQSFIHKDYLESDLKYVKRFRETELGKEDFKKIFEYIRKKKLSTIATPFDNESLPLFKELDLSIIKIASCSIDDWALLKEVAQINKKIVISTAGAELTHLKKVYQLFNKYKRNFSFMHCVGEYPTPNTHANLERITLLKETFPDIEIGFSTHESPHEPSLAPYAVALGASLIEKHVGIETDEVPLNAYSCSPADMKRVLQDVDRFQSVYTGRSDDEVAALTQLKRGVYLNKDIKKGQILKYEDIYFAMPLHDGQAHAGEVDDEWGWLQRRKNLIGATAKKTIKKDAPVLKKSFKLFDEDETVKKIRKQALKLLEMANVTTTEKDEAEISAHYGLDNYDKTGALIVSKVNLKFCKKLILMFKNQSHPEHYHMRKDEMFELIHGDCKLILNDEVIKLKVGYPVVINAGTRHSFSSKNGCVIEEVSTTHYTDDSKYTDPDISKLRTQDRKIKIKLI